MYDFLHGRVITIDAANNLGVAYRSAKRDDDAIKAYEKAVALSPSDASFHLFVGPWSTFSAGDRARDYLTKQGLSFETRPAEAGQNPKFDDVKAGPGPPNTNWKNVVGRPTGDRRCLALWPAGAGHRA